MAETNAILQSILDQLSAITVRLADKSVAQERDEQSLKDYQDRQRSPKVEKDIASIAMSLKQTASGSLGANEKQRIEKTAKIYNQVYKLSENHKVLKDILNVLTETEREKDQANLFAKPSSTPKVSTVKTEKEKPHIFSSILGSIGGGAAILAIGLGVYNLIKSMVDFKKIDTKTIVLFGGALSILGLALWKFSSTAVKLARSAAILQAMLAIGGIALAFNREVVPGLKGLVGVKWDDIKGGLAGAAAALTGMLVLVELTSKFLTSSISGGLATAAAVGTVFVASKVLGVLATSVSKFAAFKWDEVKGGLGAAAVALGGMSVVIGAITALFIGTEGLAALAVGAAELAIWGAIELIGRTADVLHKFKGIDTTQLENLGKSLVPFTFGVASFLTLGVAASTLGTIVSAATAWLGLDPTTQIRKFQDLKYDYMAPLGVGLKALGEGILNFFSIGGSIGSFIEGIKSWAKLDIVSQIKRYEDINTDKLTAVGNSFSVFAGGLRELASVTTNLKNLNIDIGKLSKSVTPIKLNMEVKTLTEMKDALVELGRNELQLMSQQIALLKENNFLLGRLSEIGTTNVSIGAQSSNARPSFDVSREKSTTRQSLFELFRLEGSSIRE